MLDFVGFPRARRWLCPAVVISVALCGVACSESGTSNTRVAPGTSLFFVLDMSQRDPHEFTFLDDGRMSFVAACNSITADWEFDDETLQVSDGVTTDIDCGDVGNLQEAALLQLLSSAKLVKTEVGTELIGGGLRLPTYATEEAARRFSGNGPSCSEDEFMFADACLPRDQSQDGSSPPTSSAETVPSQGEN